MTKEAINRLYIFSSLLNHGLMGSFLRSSVLAEESIFSWRTNTGAARTLATRVKLAMKKPTGRLWPFPNSEGDLFPSNLVSKDSSQTLDRPSSA